MVVGVLSSIVSAILIGGASVIWRHRHNLLLLRTALYPRGLVRVSYAALLRVKDDDHYVLLRSQTRPGFYGPPGGVFKHHETAATELDALGFREQRFNARRADMKADLRGFVPAWSAAGFFRWFVTAEDHETGPECLRRELAEELSDVGDDGVADDIKALTFRRVRVVVEGPNRVPGESYREMRRFEVYDLAVNDEASARFRRRLISASEDPSDQTVRRATGTEITTGWCDTTPITPHAAYLLGSKRFRPNIPARP